MEVQIRDAAALRQVSPAHLRAYLEAEGWTREENWRDRISVWAKAKDGQIPQLLAPLREHSDTYALRIGEAVTLLAEIEDRSQLAVYYDLLAAGADVIRLRPLEKTPVNGSLHDSVAFLGQVRDLVMAAARAAERPGLAVYRGRLSGQVEDYVRKIRPALGYESGDELTLHSPVPAEYSEQRDLEGVAHRRPFARRSTLALYAGLHTARDAVDSVLGGAPLSVFDTAAPQGASANFCTAVAALARQSRGIAVSLSWAKVRPEEVADGAFAFAESAAEVFEGGAERLRQRSPFLDAPITGEIVRLDRQSHEQFDGQAVVLSEMDGRPAALQVQFAVEDKEEVLRAFEQGLEISVTGDIYREGRRYALQNPRNFVVLAG